MPATVRATSQFVATGSVTSGTVPLPTGWQAGDVLYIFIVLASATGTITAPAGYTELIANFHNSGTTSATMELCRKVLTSSESAPVGHLQVGAAVLYRRRGAGRGQHHP